VLWKIQKKFTLKNHLNKNNNYLLKCALINAGNTVTTNTIDTMKNSIDSDSFGTLYVVADFHEKFLKHLYHLN
jgi:hypothetical protein